eukprot:7457996-Heterocapsa_arctica.AAC.1
MTGCTCASALSMRPGCWALARRSTHTMCAHSRLMLVSSSWRLAVNDLRFHVEAVRAAQINTQPSNNDHQALFLSSRRIIKLP